MKEMLKKGRLVVKIGSSTLTYENGKLNIRRMEQLVQVLSDLKNSGWEVVLVSSGAVAAGAGKLGYTSAERSTEVKQALSAVGQAELMRAYERLFAAWGHIPAQMLLTKDVMTNEIRRKNAENTFKTLFEMGALPIVNENDSVSFEGIKFGGNDTLAAYVAIVCNADLLVNLSDTNGLYDSDPRKNLQAKLIPLVERVDERIMSMAGGAGSGRGTGGMKAKLQAACMVTDVGIPMVICSGADPHILYDIVDGKLVGTLFTAAKTPASGEVR